jgi:DNA-binding CsgD family transcriptional regulator
LTLLKYLLKKASLIVPNLTPREIEIIHLLYNVDSNKKTTLEEVGKKFDLSRERIRQIKEKVIRKIKSSTYFKVDSDLKEIKTQNDPIDNRFEKSRRKLDLYKINPTLDLAYYELPNISDIEKGIYFKLEQLKSFTPINYQLSKTWLDDFNLDELRKENILNNRLMNNGTPITQEEIGLIVTLYKNDFSLSNLEKYFQRSEKSIENIIKANELL